MPKKLQTTELEKIIKPLPQRERKTLAAQDLTSAWLEENIGRSKRSIKMDLWVGIPWFVLYSVALFAKGIGNLSLGIFVLGMIYFIYAIFTHGSYGLNKKRVSVYEQLLDKMKQ
ncbi:MAG: hypothetical protein EPO28_15455 [Saprospiraceae bacterium]|nr:MAG: hypothetical protein EPO28_15455 [Saprospiraceae bacterium]